MKKIPLSLICGFAAMITTIVLYFVILSNAILGIIHLVSLVAILLAEGVTTFYAWLAKGSPRKVAAAVVSAAMIPYSLILSFVYIVDFPDGYGTYLGLYIAAMVIVNTVALILFFFDSSKNEETVRLQAAKENMQMLCKLIRCVMADEAAKPYEAQLRELEEKLRFSNDCVIAPEDSEIRLMLIQLQQNLADPDFDTKGQLSRLEAIIRRRAVMSAGNV